MRSLTAAAAALLLAACGPDGPAASGGAEERLAAHRETLRGLRRETERDFLRRGARAARLGRFPAGTEVAWISAEQFHAGAGSVEWWRRLQARYPLTPGVVIFSRVGYDRGHRQALVHLFVAQQGSAYVLLSKVDGRWRETARAHDWIS